MRRRPGGAADQRRQAEALAAGLGLVLADRQLVDADEPGRTAVGALHELLGAHAVGLADAPVARGEHAPLDPAARAPSRARRRCRRRSTVPRDRS